MEVNNVFTDKVVQLGGGIFFPVLVKVEVTALVTQVFKAGHITDRGIQPDVEKLVRCIRNFETKIRRITGDIPLLQAGIQPLGQFVGYFILQGAGTGPLLQKLLEIGQFKEVVL